MKLHRDTKRIRTKFCVLACACICILTVLCQCEQAPEKSQSPSQNPPSENPVETKTDFIDPCTTEQAWSTRGLIDVQDAIDDLTTGFLGRFLIYDEDRDTLYAGGRATEGVIDAVFAVYRRIGDEGWERLYARYVDDPPRVNEADPFMDIVGAWDSQNEELFITAVDEPLRIDAVGSAWPLSFPNEWIPATSLAYDEVSQTLFVGHRLGIGSWRRGEFGWDSEASSSDLGGEHATQLIAFRDADAGLSLCARTAIGVFCRYGEGAWAEIPKVNQTISDNFLDDLAVDESSSRLFATSGAQLISSDRDAGWYRWGANWSEAVSGMVVDPAQGLYVIVRDSLFFSDETEHWSPIMKFPETTYRATFPQLSSDGSLGHVFVNWDLCPGADAFCIDSDVIAYCLNPN